MASGYLYMLLWTLQPNTPRDGRDARMDNGFEDTDAPGPSLSYDDSVPYADQVASLAERISSTKVYLLSDASKPRCSRPCPFPSSTRR